MNLPERILVAGIPFDLNFFEDDGWCYIAPDVHSNPESCRKIDRILSDMKAPSMMEMAIKIFPDYEDAYYFPTFKDDLHLALLLEELGKYGLTDGSWRDNNERKALGLT